MSGFAGMLPPNGAPVDPHLLARLAAAVRYMGPDRQGSWLGTGAGLTHALLGTSDEEAEAPQPLSIDGTCWIVADARIDGRKALLRQLRDAGQQASQEASDSELVLRSYHAWGEQCVTRLIGDFAFAIWDERKQALFCARDHFGVVPFYYGFAAGSLLFGNAVEALLAAPGCDRTLNDRTIGDYLLFGYSADPSAGFYKHVHRLPPAHRLVYRRGELKISRYWSVPDARQSGRVKDEREVVERFKSLLREAIDDRVRSSKIGVTLSGGVDSTLVAGLAVSGRSARSLEAFSIGCDWLLPDTERYWAHLCARSLGIAFHSIATETRFLSPPGGYWRDVPEPRFEVRDPPGSAILDAAQARGIRVVLTGLGGDVLVASSRSRWADFLRQGAIGTFGLEAWRHYRHIHRRPPVRGSLLRAAAGKRLRPIPAVIDAKFAAAWNLVDRQAAVTMSNMLVDPREGMARQCFWIELLSALHPESTRRPVKMRHPYFDVRLLTEAIGMPPVPLLHRKAILRRAAEGIVPAALVSRPKTPAPGSPYFEAARQGYEPWLSRLGEATELAPYVDQDRLVRLAADIAAVPRSEYERNILYPAGLAAWIGRACS